MIQNILAMLGVAQQPAQLDPIDLFMQGYSIPAISASAGRRSYPGQRQIESEIRAYVLELEQQIADLQARIERAP